MLKYQNKFTSIDSMVSLSSKLVQNAEIVLVTMQCTFPIKGSWNMEKTFKLVFEVLSEVPQISKQAICHLW